MADVTPHLAFPVRCIGGRFLTVEQGSPRHLQDQAEILLRTRPGTLDHDPDFGLRELLARIGPAAPQIRVALERHVPAEFLTTEDESELAARVRRVAVDLVSEEED